MVLGDNVAVNTCDVDATDEVEIVVVVFGSVGNVGSVVVINVE